MQPEWRVLSVSDREEVMVGSIIMGEKFLAGHCEATNQVYY